jgi:GNAT superfamily N-acetyltransferase
METRIDVIIRRARQEDTPDVMDLTSHIWDGEDYIPQVWADWLNDPLGCLLVAESEGRILGLAKLSQSTPEDWWLQGLRVHPEFEGLGIASRLHDACLGYWREIGRGALRLATNAQRYPVHHLCERTGFVKVGDYSYFQATALDEPTSNFSLIPMEQVGRALAFSQTSPSLALTLSYMDLSWEWLPLRLSTFEKTIGRGQALWWRGDRGLLLYREDTDEDENRPIPLIEWIASNPDDLGDLLQDFRRMAGAHGYAGAGWAAPLQLALLSILEATGFERKWDGSVYLFEKTDSL